MSGDARSPEKRRLPVLQEKPGEPEPPRPAWHWVPLGAFATFLAWLPLSMAVEAIVRRVAASAEAHGDHLKGEGLWMVGGHTVAFFAGATIGGLLVGRLAPDATRRHPPMGGALAAILGWLIAANQGTPGGALTWALLLALMMAIGAGGGALGGALGRRWRARSPADPPA